MSKNRDTRFREDTLATYKPAKNQVQHEDYAKFMPVPDDIDTVYNLAFTALKSGAKRDLIEETLDIYNGEGHERILRFKPHELQRAYFELMLLTYGANITYDRIREKGNKYVSGVTYGELIQLGCCVHNSPYTMTAILNAIAIAVKGDPYASASDIKGERSGSLVQDYIGAGIASLDSLGMDRLYEVLMSSLVALHIHFKNKE